MNKSDLEEWICTGNSIQDIAHKTKKSKTTVRFWLNKYDLKTTGKAGRPPHTITNDTKYCKKCGETKSLSLFSIRTDRPGVSFTYCKQCIAADVAQRSLYTKQFFVNALGNVCKCCNKTFHAAVYDFHHTEAEHKDFNIRQYKLSSDISSIQKELKKCILVCANCHQYIHYTMKQQVGYNNKITGNTELWNNNKTRKLLFLNKDKCDNCGYHEYEGALGIIFPDNLKFYRKYNKTHWDDDFKNALTQAFVLCLNCIRMT